MTFDVLSDLNWLAVVVAALAYFAVGALWYSPPLFGNVWMAAAGNSTPEDGSGPGPAVYVVPLIGSILAAIALGMIAQASGTDTVGEGIVLGLVAGVGFAVAIAAVTATFESSKPKPMTWGAINAGYHLVGIVVASIIIAIWD
ncbi:MAG: DUF1761 domain-containing protein [Actinomycetota bacterium]